MILIVGDTHDDVLYFETVLANKKTAYIFDRFKISIGTISSEEVVIIRDANTSILASSIISYILAGGLSPILEKEYAVNLVIGVGKCIGVSEGLKSGNIAISSAVIDTDVDLSKIRNVGFAEIPGFSRRFSVNNDDFVLLSENINKRPTVDFYKTTFLASDNMSQDMINYLREHKNIFSATQEERFVVDHNSAGIALACSLVEIPFIIVKVIEHGFDLSSNLRTYTNVLTKYVDLGKGVTEAISNIGRSDVAEGETYEIR